MNRGEGGCIITENREMKRKRVRERKTISAQEETVESFNCHPPVSISIKLKVKFFSSHT